MTGGIETIGEAHDLGWKVRARCAYGRHDGLKRIRECTWSYELDMQTLVATRGRAFPIARLAERLRCPRCGSHDISVMFVPPSSTMTTAARKGGRG